MSEKKKFLLRIDEGLYTSLEKWAASDLRSVNAQIEFLLSDALRKAGRLKAQEQSNVRQENSDQALIV
jgi:hypothetical protein